MSRLNIPSLIPHLFLLDLQVRRNRQAYHRVEPCIFLIFPSIEPLVFLSIQDAIYSDIVLGFALLWLLFRNFYIRWPPWKESKSSRRLRTNSPSARNSNPVPPTRPHPIANAGTSSSGSGRSLQDSASTPTASFFNFACGMMQRLRHAPKYLIITPKVESSPLPYTPQLLHNYYDEVSNEKLSRLMTLFNRWLISNYKYANSDLYCHSILALEHFNALAHS